MLKLRSADCAVLGQFPNAPANSWSDVLTDVQRDTYRRTHDILGALGATASAKYPGEFDVVTTSGFTAKSGVRNQRPKDLWVSLVNKNSGNLVRMPQIYMIASGRGVELGFSAAIHRSDFSDAKVKAKLKRTMPLLFSVFPDSDSAIIEKLQTALSRSIHWQYRKKARLDGAHNDFQDLRSLISDLKTEVGMRRGSATIARYYPIDNLDDESIDLSTDFREAVEIFQPLMAAIRGEYRTIEDVVVMNNLLAGAGANTDADELARYAPESACDARRHILSVIAMRQGQGPFRRNLIKAYDGRCAVTGSSATETLEAAHIYPYNGKQTNHISNGLLLRADIHTLFDLGLMTINDDFTVSISKQVVDAQYRSFHGQQIRFPVTEAARPRVEALRWHRENIAAA